MKNNPIKQLTAEDIARKQKKLDRINTKIGKKEQKFKDKVSSGKKGTDMDIANFEKGLTGLKERRHKTEYQINTGKRGRPTSLKNEAWLADSPVNNTKKKKNLDAGKYYEEMDKKCPPGHMFLGKSRGCVKIGGRKNKQKK